MAWFWLSLSTFRPLQGSSVNMSALQQQMQSRNQQAVMHILSSQFLSTCLLFLSPNILLNYFQGHQRWCCYATKNNAYRPFCIIRSRDDAIKIWASCFWWVVSWDHVITAAHCVPRSRENVILLGTCYIGRLMRFHSPITTFSAACGYYYQIHTWGFLNLDITS